MNPNQLVATADRMVARLNTIIVDDPGTRAALRRGLGRPPQDLANFHAHAVVAPYLPTSCDEATERAFYTVAALVAAQPRSARDQVTDSDEAGEEPEPAPDSAGATTSGESAAEIVTASQAASKHRPNLGQTLAWAVEHGHLTNNPKRDPIRDRLHVLARYRTNRLHRELPKLIAYLRGQLVQVDWGYLLRDLARWEQDRERVAKEWVQQYHRTRGQIQRARERTPNAESGTSDNPGSEPT
ncbi:type I-E CRISPR-associated protein Cse2/CasB [Lipingzhangella sp. LS1_29]|uniref:Type I-E CRISPR-associated protein Cse2/CasB n=1 Tax=Lipingzhangella rawalii TaxID=2055835 RepID=A0ABU2H3B2_9ACTN|nr:type I-E CRISPR-associated protein Cse2/CasB [Lipingzhangella rawalii]MDS1269789.1 type I-E CRISPR-associated protein Cse2/CasB [Lipingzhangella rawalii]